MKKKWISKWRRSVQPRKQRKFRANAPLHVARKFMRVRLAKDLKQKYGKRNFSVRNGDSVKIMSGEYKGKLLKVGRVDIKHRLVYPENLFLTKKDGNKIQIGIQPSNLMIMSLNLDDKRRKEALGRK